MTEQTVGVFSEVAVDRLGLYLSEAESLDEFLYYVDDLVQQDGSTDLLPVTGSGSAPELTGNKKRDADDAVSVYQFVGSLSPVRASDRRLWTYLASVTLREYSMRRWLEGEERWRTFVAEHCLIRRPSLDSLSRNAISRLWWAAHLTHDPDLTLPLTQSTNDPFAYLRILFQSQDRFAAIFQRQISTNRILLLSMLHVIATTPIAQEEAFVRAFAIEVRLLAGYRELNGLDFDEVVQALNRLVHGVAASLGLEAQEESLLAAV